MSLKIIEFLKSKKALLLKITAGIFAFVIVLLTAGYLIAVAHKKEILDKVTTTINANINGHVSIGNINFTLFEKFPSLSIRVNNILITDSLAGIKKDTLFIGSTLSFQIRIMKLIIGQVSFGSFKLKDASIRLIKTANGASNTQLIKPRKESFEGEKKKSGKSVPRVQNIFLENVSFSMVDSMKMKFFGMKFVNTTLNMNQADSLINITVLGKVDFKSLTFNQQKGGYLTDKKAQLNLQTSFNLYTSTLIINGGTVEIDKQLINMNGKFSLSGEPKMYLHFDSRSILPSVAFSVLPTLIGKKLAVYSLEKPVVVSIEVNGSLVPGSKPAVDIYFKSTNNRLAFAGRSFDSLNLIGVFVNHIDSTKINDDHNSRVYLPVFNAKLNGILPLKAQMMVTDLIQPELLMWADVKLDKDEGAQTLNSERYDVYSGKADIHLDYKGPLVNYVDTPNNRLLADIKGSVFMSDLSFDHLASGSEFRNLRGSFNFDENDLNIDSLYLEMNKNSVKIKGNIQQFIAFLFLPDVKAVAKLDLNAGVIDINSFKSVQSDSARKIKEAKKAALAGKQRSKNTLSNKIDMLVDKLELDFNLTAQKIVFERFVATDVKSSLSVASDHIYFKNTSLKTGGGSFLLNGGFTQLNKSIHQVNLSSVISNVDISKMMYAFDDFGQNAISYSQISGTVSAKIDLKASMSRSYKLDQGSLKGTIDLTIKKGELRDIEGFQQVQKYIFKNRDFSKIQFAEIKNKFSLDGSLVDISKLELYSSVMTLFIEGKYDLDKINTDMTIQIPFSNLQNIEAEERIDKTDSTLKKGGSLYLRATNNKDGKIQVLPIIVRKKSGDRKTDKSNVSDSTSHKNRKK